MRKFYLIPFSRCAKLFLAVILFIQFSLPAAAAEAQTMNNTNVSFRAKNLTLKEVFKLIEKKSNFLIGYDNVIDARKRVSLTVENKSVYSILRDLLKDYKGNVTQVDDHHVLIRVEKQVQSPVAPVKSTQPAVDVPVSGTVTDMNGLPLPGVTVVDLASGRKVGTDLNGKFAINATSGAKLSFNYVGYDRQDVQIDNQKVLTIRMKESSNSLQEVVAIGYQKVRRSDVTGAISSVKASELNLSAPTIGQALVGKVAGVQVSQTSGAPYASTKIRVRGIGSLNASSDPLYVIDGYPAGNNIFVNPEDIETIDILKDAASAAIYGSRAAGGVVLITTKKGKDGRGRFEYDVQVGVSQLAKKIKLLNATQFAELSINSHNNAYKDLVVNSGKPWTDAMYSDPNATRVALVGNSGSVSIDPAIYNFGTQSLITPTTNTDWQDELYRNAFFQRHNLSFSGGAKDIKYFVSGGYQDQDGIVTATSIKTVNFRSNIEANVNKRMKVGANISYTQTNGREVEEGRFSPMMSALLYIPYFAARDANGVPIQYAQNALANQFGYQGIENPIAQAEQTKITRLGYRNTYNAYATYDILEGLTFKANLGTQVYTEKYDYYLPTSLSAGGSNPPYSPQSIANANARAQNLTQTDKLAEFTLNYDKTIGKHHFDVLGGYSAQENSNDFTYLTAKGFTNDNVTEITGKGADPAFLTLTQAYKQKYTLLSYFGRFSYNYNSKYFLTGSLRKDGSSRFGSLNKYGTFPSVAAGWTLSQEDWYNDFLGQQSSVKLRASWGLSGNNNIGNYNSIQTQGPATGVVFGSGTVSSGVSPNVIKDANIGWESTSQYNLGTDISVLKNRLSFSVNYYLSRSYNLLFLQPISAVSGYPSILTNLSDSKVQNKGLDFQIDGTVIRGRDFTFGASGNISFNKNKVLDLGGASTIYTTGAERSYLTHITAEGQSIGMFYGYKVLGRLTADNVGKEAQSSASTNPAKIGDLYFEDLNKDGIVNEQDKQVIGSPYAKFTYGFALSFTYKAFDLRTSFNGSYGNKVLDGQDYYLYNFEGSGNQYAEVADRYISEAQPGSGLNYRPSRGGTQSNSTRLSSFYLQDGSYLRLTNATLGYNIPKSLTERLKVQNIRVYGSVDNAFTLTKYKGYNPDVDYNINATNTATGTSTANLAPGVDYGNYPLARTFSLGIKVTF
ncbi:SusC/RagA family TonB-linked outer membrane protein [Pedobacter hartonius]|uniref:TonB-linked outer membrane protein, SusC/RagA family n=1 Tax=Pedobacter hartonius TaxID=425514 RepID=A0A1H4DTX7_9SPHI|nr:TonB-dependent receptor [Pedobacter hartonius]SEA75959.1 TonB-linked outer membrane protein, SusC/RagA family [Pedobacter hartonius]